MTRVLLLYSTNFGLSQRICERIAALLRPRGLDARVCALTDPGVDPADCEVIVIGASIKHGKHQPSVLEFIQRHRATLEARPGALFSVNLVARKPHRNTPETNPYLRRLVAQSPWKPRLLGVFAGELDYSRYGPVDKHMMRLVMWINRGPTDLKTKVAFTNWDEVDRYAERVAALAGVAPRA